MKNLEHAIEAVIIVLLAFILISFLAILTTGCATRTIYVPHGEPVRLRADVKDHPVWVQDAEGRWVPGRVTLKEGWYALPKAVK